MDSVPEMMFDVRRPDGSARTYYSPSLVVEEYLEAGRRYDLDDFTARCPESLTIASERVRAKYGFPCSWAVGSPAGIERDAARVRATGFGGGTATVTGRR